MSAANIATAFTLYKQILGPAAQGISQIQEGVTSADVSAIEDLKHKLLKLE